MPASPPDWSGERSPQPCPHSTSHNPWLTRTRPELFPQGWSIYQVRLKRWVALSPVEKPPGTSLTTSATPDPHTKPKPRCYKQVPMGAARFPYRAGREADGRPLATFLHTEGIQAQGHYSKASFPDTLTLGRSKTATWQLLVGTRTEPTPAHPSQGRHLKGACCLMTAVLGSLVGKAG